MTTIAHSLRELAAQTEALGLGHKVEVGNVYWVQNEAIRFGDCSSTRRHPVLVTRVEGRSADVCILTSKINGNRHNGIRCEPIGEAGLRKSGVVLTKPFGRRRLDLTVLGRESFGGRLPIAYQWVVREAYAKASTNPNGPVPQPCL